MAVLTLLSKSMLSSFVRGWLMKRSACRSISTMSAYFVIGPERAISVGFGPVDRIVAPQSGKQPVLRVGRCHTSCGSAIALSSGLSSMSFLPVCGNTP